MGNRNARQTSHLGVYVADFGVQDGMPIFLPIKVSVLCIEKYPWTYFVVILCCNMFAFTVQITTISLPLGAYFISNIFYVERAALSRLLTSVLPPPSPLRAPCSHYCGAIILLVQGNQVKSALYRLKKYIQTGISQNHSLNHKCIIRHLQRIVISEICRRFPIYFSV